MPRYRVTLRSTTVEIVTADNPYQAAIVAAAQYGDSVDVADVRPVFGRLPASTSKATARTTVKKSVKKVAKKRRPMSAETRAKLAKNLVKARAARAKKAQAAKGSTKKATKKAR